MKPKVIVWDLETVPDLGGFAAANDLVGKSDAEVREAIFILFQQRKIFTAHKSRMDASEFGTFELRQTGSREKLRYVAVPRR